MSLEKKAAQRTAETIAGQCTQARGFIVSAVTLIEQADRFFPPSQDKSKASLVAALEELRRITKGLRREGDYQLWKARQMALGQWRGEQEIKEDVTDGRENED